MVFTGGMGSHSPAIRSRICAGLGFIGAIIDEGANQSGQTIISKKDNPVEIMVMQTDEEGMMAKHAFDLLKNN